MKQSHREWKYKEFFVIQCFVLFCLLFYLVSERQHLITENIASSVIQTKRTGSPPGRIMSLSGHKNAKEKKSRKVDGM